MHRFYVAPEQVQDNKVSIIGSDVNHIKNVLRMNSGDKLIICNGQGKDCYCIIDRVDDKEINCNIISELITDTELNTKITLFQGLPKKDKMELIIQKAVELGVHEIIPVMTKRVIVKLEDKKREEKKLERWQAIAESAAKQSHRGIIPKIRPVISYDKALEECSKMDIALIPYENAEGITRTREIIASLSKYSSVGVVIGPEGGFEETEIELALERNTIPITLGRRILRTETAGLAVLSMMMLSLEKE